MKSAQEISNRLATLVKEKRAKLGLTQEELAEIAKIDYKHIQNIESLKRINDPKLSTLLKLASALNMSISEIVDYLFK
ncbi:MAG: helix-turn-helix transcriptional regulator [Deltaproteobacteria bacterium]|nr:helix-turn-helix transcriptional regulator [Deltaproteobacteria bacterium]